MKVRAAVPDDLPRLLALERQADTAAHWGEQHYSALLTQAASGTGESGSGPRRICLVVEVASESQAGVKAGAASATGEEAPGARSEVAGFIVAQSLGAEWEIENLAVEAGSRRRGLASRLLQQLLGCALEAGATHIALEVRESNHAARGLYAKWGFREAGQRRNYYRDPQESAILLLYTATPAGTKGEAGGTPCKR